MLTAARNSSPFYVCLTVITHQHCEDSEVIQMYYIWNPQDSVSVDNHFHLSCLFLACYSCYV